MKKIKKRFWAGNNLKKETTKSSSIIPPISPIIVTVDDAKIKINNAIKAVQDSLNRNRKK